MLIGPDNFTRPPASQRSMLSERMPLVPEEAPMRPGVKLAWWALFLVLCVAIWAMFFAAVLS